MSVSEQSSYRNPAVVVSIAGVVVAGSCGHPAAARGTGLPYTGSAV